MLGKRIFDPESNKKFLSFEVDRNFGDPLSIVTHEYEHLMDDPIEIEDGKKINSIVFNMPGDNNLKKEAYDYAKTKIDKNNLDYGSLTIIDLNLAMVPADGFMAQLEAEWREDNGLYEGKNYRAIIDKYNFSPDTSDTDVEKYIQLKEEFYKDMKKRYTIRKVMDPIYKKFREEDYSTANKKAIQYMIEKSEYGGELRDTAYQNQVKRTAERYLGDILVTTPDTMPLQAWYNKIAIDAGLQLIKDNSFQEMVKSAFETLELEKDSFNEKDKKIAETYLNLYKEKGVTNPLQVGVLRQFAVNNRNIDLAYKK